MSTKHITITFLLLSYFIFPTIGLAQDISIQKPAKKAQTVPDKKVNTAMEKMDNSHQTQISTPTSSSINGHEWVDLGLSVKWATCNIGANSSSDYGNYYAWGETKPKSEYTVENSLTYGQKMSSIAGNPNYDAATAIWGGTWRLPTDNEMQELVDRCNWIWTIQGGHKGYKIIGPNGNNIFLPAAGEHDGSSCNSIGIYGLYWSANPDENDERKASVLSFGAGGFGLGWDCPYRNYGWSIRPVTRHKVNHF